MWTLRIWVFFERAREVCNYMHECRIASIHDPHSLDIQLYEADYSASTQRASHQGIDDKLTRVLVVIKE
jgi:hypothetical protein